jgi:hypothetical protein
MDLKAEQEQRAGCIQLRRARQTGRVVGVYRSLEAGIEIDPELPWTTVCEEHSTCVFHATRAPAIFHASDPMGWCGVCNGTETE